MTRPKRRSARSATARMFLAIYEPPLMPILRLPARNVFFWRALKREFVSSNSIMRTMTAINAFIIEVERSTNNRRAAHGERVGCASRNLQAANNRRRFDLFVVWLRFSAFLLTIFVVICAASGEFFRNFWHGESKGARARRQIF